MINCTPRNPFKAHDGNPPTMSPKPSCQKNWVYYIKAYEVHHCPLRILFEALLFTIIWLVLSHEQMSKRWPFSIINDEQMRNWFGEWALAGYFLLGRPPPPLPWLTPVAMGPLGMRRVQRSWWIRGAFGSDQRCNTRTEYIITSRHTSKGESVFGEKCEQNVWNFEIYFLYVFQIMEAWWHNNRTE